MHNIGPGDLNITSGEKIASLNDIKEDVKKISEVSLSSISESSSSSEIKNTPRKLERGSNLARSNSPIKGRLLSGFFQAVRSLFSNFHEKSNQINLPRKIKTISGLFKEIIEGKAKKVWKKKGDKLSAYYTPVKQNSLFKLFLRSKEAEIREEVETAKKIKKKLDPTGESDQEWNLALDLSVEEDKIEDEYTVKTSRAGIKQIDSSGAKRKYFDLDQKVNEDPPHFSESLFIGEQILNGMANLHHAGFVHGDPKLANVLTYPEEKVKVSDFGKTTQIVEGQSFLYTGNSIFAPPEGRLSQPGDVFSTAIMMIRLMEGELIKESEMLMTPTRVDESAQTTKQGIEKFLITNKDCPQNETKSLRGKIQVYGRRALLQVNIDPIDLSRAQTEVHNYIAALENKLIEKYPEREQKISNISALLKKMTATDKKERPTMEEALRIYRDS